MIISRKSAREQGLKFFFTGKPCKSGHIDNRYAAGGMCVVCWKEYNKKYRVKNKVYYKEYWSNWCDKNSEYMKDKNKKIWQDKKNYFQKKWKEYRRKNGEILREKSKLYNKNNREYFNAYNAKRKAIKLQAIPKWADLEKIKQIYKKRERISEETGVMYHVDHIIPLLGKNVCGLHVENNLQIIPALENITKSNILYSQCA